MLRDILSELESNAMSSLLDNYRNQLGNRVGKGERWGGGGGVAIPQKECI